MIPRSPLRTVAVLVLLPALSSCVPPATGAAPSPTPTTPPSFGLSVPAEADLVPSASAGEWIVVGSAAAGPEDLQSPRVSILLLGPSGTETAHRTIDLPVDPLPAGTTWPFREIFRPETPPASVEASLLGDPAPAAPAPRMESEVLRTFLDAQGSEVALGRLTNRGEPGSAEIVAVRLLGRDSSGAMMDVVEAQTTTGPVAPDGQVPFLARIPAGGESLRWEAYPIARWAESGGPSVEVVDVQSREDDQRNPFVTAVVRNGSPDPLWVTLTALASDRETWLAAESAVLPFPLEPGGEFPVAIRLPWPSLGQPESADPPRIDWRLFRRGDPAEAVPVPLPAEVIAYEPLGSTLLLRIRLGGVDLGTIESPTALASLTGEDGQLLGAGWSVAAEGLGSSEEVVLTVAIPVPRGFDLTLGEVDVHGFGLHP